jgi:hypothetical protein
MVMEMAGCRGARSSRFSILLPLKIQIYPPTLATHREPICKFCFPLPSMAYCGHYPVEVVVLLDKMARIWSLQSLSDYTTSGPHTCFMSPTPHVSICDQVVTPYERFAPNRGQRRLPRSVVRICSIFQPSTPDKVGGLSVRLAPKKTVSRDASETSRVSRDLQIWLQQRDEPMELILDRSAAGVVVR